MENADFDLDFRDYQTSTECKNPFDLDYFLDFLDDPATVIDLSCMANLLPFTIMTIKAIKNRYPDRIVVLCGVGAASVEDKILRRFPCKAIHEQVFVLLELFFLTQNHEEHEDYFTPPIRSG